MLANDTTEPQTDMPITPEPEANQAQPTPEPSANPVEPAGYWAGVAELFSICDKQRGVYSARELARTFSNSDTAVRKAHKALTQAVSADVMRVDEKFTELGKALMQAYFQRAEQITGAAWIHKLAEVVGALPQSVTAAPKESVADSHKARKERLEQQRGAIVLSAQNKLEALVAELEADDFGSDEVDEAEIELARERAYEREMALQIAALEGRMQARKDLRKRLEP
ncbi:MAG TPA: hypothetical protein V6D06_14830 [Trichocoleus sp.]